MKFITRCGGVFILLALFTFSALAQDGSADITVVGSGIAQPVFQALADASESEANLVMTITGTSTGFTQFCAGEADMTTANRKISTNENADCVTNNQTYFELLIGEDILAFVINPEANLTQCLTSEQLAQIFAPSAQGQTTNWNQVIPEGPDTPLTVHIPSDNTAAYAILDGVVEGDGIRSDATVQTSAADLIAAVGDDSGAISAVPLADALSAGDAVQILELNAGEIDECQAPSAENVEDDLYPAADQLYLYVNSDSLDKTGVTDLLNFITDEETATIIEEQGFFAPTDTLFQKNRDIVQSAISGEPIIPTTSEFTVPPGVGGTVSIGGASNGFEYIQSVSGTFTTTNPDITVDTTIEGGPAGFRRLCNGELDIVIADRDMTADEAANCEANNITTLSLDLGKQAVVLVANAESNFLACLTTDQITTIWSAESGDQIMTWDQVSADFSDTPMTLFAPDAGSPLTDLMLSVSSGSELVNRADTEENADPLYRAAATANVEGSLTFMSWQDYQNVLDNNQPNIQLVAVDSGSGCVTPTLDTIVDGSYGLVRPGQLIINHASLAKLQVQSFVWYLASNENYPNLDAFGFVGVRFGDLANVLDELQRAFTEAEIAALNAAAAEATPEATAEATAEATEASE